MVKVGMTSGITKGYLHVDGTSVRVSDIDLTLDQTPFGTLHEKVLRQYEIIPLNGQSFAGHGDSGALVFLVDNTGPENQEKLTCIGMLIGCTNYLTGIVTPIGDVLQALNLNHGFHKFTEESMEQ